MKYIEPMRGYEFEFKLIPISKLCDGQFQRQISKRLVNKLVCSTDYGFVLPLVVVERGNDNYEVIDGQHRLETIKKRMDDADVPCIVVPEDFKFRPLLLNTEKGDNVKDKCTKIYNVYMWTFENLSDKEENYILPAASYDASLLTLAFAYNEFTLESPSLVETVVKKFDSVIDDVISLAIDERRRRAQKVSELSMLVNEIALENGFKDFNLKKAVVSKSSMALWGRSRTLGLDFDSAMNDLMMQIEQTDWSMFGG